MADPAKDSMYCIKLKMNRIQDSSPFSLSDFILFIPLDGFESSSEAGDHAHSVANDHPFEFYSRHNTSLLHNKQLKVNLEAKPSAFHPFLQCAFPR